MAKQEPLPGASRTLVTARSGKTSLTRRMFQAAAFTPLAMAGSLGAEPGKTSAASEAEKIAGIPPLKYDLESQTHWVGEAGSAKEATVEEFPVSQSIAGVSMRLKPGAIRELHWHALAAEWAYVIEGRCRATVIAPNGQTEIAEFHSRRYLVLPSRPWARFTRTGARRMPLPAGVRQRTLLRVRDLQHYRLDRAHRPGHCQPCAQRGAVCSCSIPEERSLHRSRRCSVRRARRISQCRLEPSQLSHKYRLDQVPAQGV